MSISKIPIREDFADSLKGIAIIGVVCIHVSRLFFGTDGGFINYYFHWAVPVFIIISTYFFIKSDIKKHNSYSNSCKKRFIGLFVPYIFFSLIYFFLTSEPNISILKIITRHFTGYGWTGQYFFIIMLQLVFVFPLFSRFKISNLSVVLAFAIYLLPFIF